MELAKKLEPLQTLVENMPPTDQLPVYVGGLLRLLRTGVGIQLDSVFHENEIAEQGPDFFNGVESGFFKTMTEYIFREMEWVLEIDGRFPDKPGGRWVYIMNHPSLLATWAPLHLASQTMAPHTAAVAKSDIIENRLTAFLLGKPMQDIGRVGFIKRPEKPEEREEAYQGVRQAVHTVLRPDTGLIFFPDTHRPYRPRIEKERKTWSEKLPEANVDDWMTETCFPRSGGLWNLLQATEGMEDVRYMDFTVAEPRKRRDRFHIALNEVTREEMMGKEATERHLQAWLLEDWKEKNRVIREWRGGGR